MNSTNLIFTLSCKSGAYFLNGKRLLPERSQKVRNHSPDGFNHGYGGSGAAQLALGALLELLPKEQAQKHYQDFKWQCIAALPQEDFERQIAYTITGQEK